MGGNVQMQKIRLREKIIQTNNSQNIIEISVTDEEN